MKHTKGEWEVKEWNTTGTDFYHIRSKDKFPDLIATIFRWKGHIDKREAKANAKLIAAAPELLETLIQLNEGFIREWGIEGNSERVCGNIDYWNRLASATIKKATE